MPIRLKTKIDKLRHQGHLTDKEADRIIRSLEKQKAKDMTIKYEREGYFHFDNYYCPTCGLYLGNDNDGEYWAIHWCNRCGQHVKYDNYIRLSRMCGDFESAVHRDECLEENGNDD